MSSLNEITTERSGRILDVLFNRPARKNALTARETAERFADKPAGALRAVKMLLKRSFREELRATARAEMEEFTSRVRSAEAKAAFAASFGTHRTEAR